LPTLAGYCSYAMLPRSISTLTRFCGRGCKSSQGLPPGADYGCYSDQNSNIQYRKYILNPGANAPGQWQRSMVAKYCLSNTSSRVKLYYADTVWYCLLLFSTVAQGPATPSISFILRYYTWVGSPSFATGPSHL
jgi:hypothetical protein